MNKEQQKAKELAELLTAFADENQLQIHKQGDLLWEDYEFNINDIATMTALIHQIGNPMYQFRIKPETKRIALNQQDLIDRELSGKTMWVRYEQFDTKYWQIAGFDAYSVFFAFDEIDYDLIMTFGTFLDNSPCYKEVESE